MRSRLGLMLAAAMAASATRAAQAATLAVTITGQSETGYELNVSGIQKTGRLAAAPGAATVRDLVDIGRRELVKAVVTFTGSGGVLATCAALEVKVRAAEAACEPTFVLTGRQTGASAYACESTCEPRKRTEKTHPEEEDDDDWVYALNARDNHMYQSFYTSAMFSGRGLGLYSPAGVDRP